MLMNVGLPRNLKSLYRKEPIYSLLLTVGLVDAAIGGVGDRLGLLSFGIGTASVAIALWLWKAQQNSRPEPLSLRPQRYLPPAPSELPNLSLKKQRPS